MASINTSMEFLESPYDPMGERGHVSPWKRPKQIQPSSHLAVNRFEGNGTFPLFSPASQVPPSLLGPETTFQTPFFQCANRETDQRQGVQTHTSVFQTASRNRDISEQVLLQSSQSPLDTSQMFNSYEDSQSIYLKDKQAENDNCNVNKTSNIVTPAVNHPVAKKVPVFKKARSKTYGMPLAPENKGKKRLIPPSEENPTKKHPRLPSFTHSQVSAFKPVSRNDTPESAHGLPPLSSSTKENCETITSDSKTQPLKPKFGKPHQCPNKKIKNEINPDVADLGNGEGNREESATTLKTKIGKKSKVGHAPQTGPSSLPVKDELDTEEDNVDATGTSGIENISESENLLALTPIQCPSPDKKIKNKKQSKKNLPSILSNKINQLHGTKTKKKIHSELDPDGKMSQPQDMKANKKWQLQGVKGKKKNTSQATEDIKSDQSQAAQGYKKKKTPKVISNINKKNPLNDCDSKHKSHSDMQLKKKVFTKTSSSSTTKQQSTKHGLMLQLGKDACCFHADDPDPKISVGEDITEISESILPSSPPHDTSESALEMSDARPTSEPPSAPDVAQTNSLDKETTLHNCRAEKETARNEDETTTFSESAKENVMKLLNSMDEDLWVQCDRCLKWRRLTHIIDPATLPDKWYCTMLPIPGKNTCQEPEEEWQDIEVPYIYYEHQFVVGSVVWAQVPGSPWWPAMVDIDPDYRRYDWVNSTFTHPTSYHVTFFADPVMRAWVTCKNIRVFKQQDTYKRFINDGKKDPTRDLQLRKAVQEASHALSMEVRRRRRTYAFVVRYTGKIGKSPVNSHSGKNKETPDVKTSSPLNMTFAQRKHKKESKRLHHTASRIVMQPRSAELRDNAAVRKKYPKNTQSHLSQVNEQPGNKDERQTRKEQNSDEKLHKQIINFANSKKKKNTRNVKGLRDDADSIDIINRNSKEITSKMKHCNIDDYGTKPGNESSESHETVSSDSNTDSIQNDNRKLLSKMSKKNGMDNNKGSEQTSENIDHENSATSEGHSNSNEVTRTETQENEEISDNENGVENSSNESDSKNSSSLPQTSCDDSHETDEQYDSFSSDGMRNKRQDNDTYKSNTKNVTKMNYEYKGDNQNYAGDKEHDRGKHIKEDYAVQENERYSPQEDIESGNQGPYDTECEDDKQGDNKEDDSVDENLDSASNSEEHNSDSSDQEQDETEINSMGSDSESSHEQYDTDSSHEDSHIEGGHKTYHYKGNRKLEQNDQDASEDEYEKFGSMEHNHEQDNDYEGQDNEENCEAQSSYDDNGGDYEKDNEGVYERQDSEDSDEAQANHDYKQDNEKTYDRQDNESSREAPANYDYEQDNEEAYDGQHNEDKGETQADHDYEQDNEEAYDGQHNEDSGETQDDHDHEQDNGEAYEGQDNDSGEALAGDDYDQGNEDAYEGQDNGDRGEVSHDYEDYGDHEHPNEDNYEEQDDTKYYDNGSDQELNDFEEQDNCEYGSEDSECDYKKHNENYEQYEKRDYEEQSSGEYEKPDNVDDK